MSDISVFQDKNFRLTEKDLADELGSGYKLWGKIFDFVLEKYPDGLAEWNYPGKKYGWSFRIKDKKEQLFTFFHGINTSK